MELDWVLLRSVRYEAIKLLGGSMVFQEATSEPAEKGNRQHDI
jgi:hypothetical protein